MAISLSASISLVDKMTAPMKQMKSQLQRFQKQTEATSGSISKMKSTMGGWTSGLVGATAGVIGLVGAQKLLNSTIGEAMRLDYNKVSLQAMFRGDQKAAKELSDFIQTKALDSVMSYQDALSSTQSFSTLTKNTGEIKEMVNLSERLNYLNPLQGFEGAGFAIKEALGGDMVSLKDRFNLTKDQVQPIKDAVSMTGKLQALDAILNKIGIDKKYLEEVNETPWAKWLKLVETGKQTFVAFGNEALASVVPFIEKMTNFLGTDKWANFKTSAAESFGAAVKGAIDLATSIAENWTPIKETIIALSGALVVLKAGFVAMSVISTVTTMMNAYKLANVGATTAAALFNGVILANPIGMIIVALAALTAGIIYVWRNFDTVKAKAIELWNRFGYLKTAVLALLGPFGMIAGAAITIYQNFDLIKSKAGTMVNSVISGVNKMIGVLNAIPGVNIPIVAKVDWGNITKSPNYSRSTGQGRQTSHAGGLSRVPYDGYGASLHKGERVLTKAENKAYSAGGAGGVVNLSVHYTGGGPMDEREMGRFADFLVRKIETAGNGGV
ncbi:hypothetical protein ACFY5J_27035 [Peribacillus butanolivorans]|uniref:hypothetical protein n=1 Tax=Peribacillus butanolivorans TaxID=421767 RepID=UPI0036BEB2BC